jgi:hypothetical protein
MVKEATNGIDPLCPYNSLVTALISALDPQKWSYNCITRQFISSKPFSIPQPSNEVWASLYVKFHGPESKYIGNVHYAAIVELLSPAELAVFIRACLWTLAQDLEKVIEVYVEVSADVKLLSSKNRGELQSFYNFACDAYWETKTNMLGQLFTVMRSVGNMVAMLYGLESEMRASNSEGSIMASVARVFVQQIENDSSLFVPTSFECDHMASHRTFPALWSVLEFLLCSPVKIGDEVERPIEVFGDGVVICAHVLVLLSGQLGLYEYDSICMKVLELAEVQKVVLKKGDLAEFLRYGRIVEQGRVFAGLIVSPFVSNRISSTRSPMFANASSLPTASVISNGTSRLH